MKFLTLIGFTFLLFTACKKEVVVRETYRNYYPTKTPELNVVVPEEPELLNIDAYNDTVFLNLKDFSRDFVYDMKYATEDNFLKTKVYDCPECYLRVKTIRALLKANSAFKEKGYRIKIFDCYRPLDIQKKMWEIMPYTNYVASPKKGSMHNRGTAIDLTLVDENGDELDMGTAFDYFGEEAHVNYRKLPENILKNRMLLKEGMTKQSFKTMSTEWWHYNFDPANRNDVSNFRWDCE